MIEVSAGVVYDREGRILICQRGEGRSNAHLWEFPGGKREAGESAAECLIRELTEELSLPVTEVALTASAVTSPTGESFTQQLGRIHAHGHHWCYQRSNSMLLL